MNIKAFFVDFYGTIVHEDGEVIKSITKIICATGKAEDPSEDTKGYKPRKELFELALKSTGLKPDEVVHIGDSISSDVQGGVKGWDQSAVAESLREKCA